VLATATFATPRKTLAFLSKTVYHIPTENAIASKKQGK
jgi:hypothetical protein